MVKFYKKEVNTLIRSKDLNLEIKKIELVAEKGNEDAVNRGLLKGVALLLKVLRDVKTNQVTIMRSTNVKLIEPRIPSKDGGKTEAKDTKKK